MSHLAGHSSPPGRQRLDRWLVAVVVLGGLMATLNATSVNVAIRTLGEEFGGSISTIQWVLTGYLLVFVAVIPITGWAGERFGAERVWTFGVVIFLVGSALSAAAWSAGALITVRLLQGIGAGMIMPSGQAILAAAAGPERMGRVMSVIGGPMLLGAVLGPVLGGLVISVAGWRWIFLVNLPFGFAALLAARRRLPRSCPRPERRLDLLGLVLLCGGVTMLILGMRGAASSAGIGDSVTELAMGAVLVVLYVAHARSCGDRAVLDLALFAKRDFAVGMAVNQLISLPRAGLQVLLPLYWQLVYETDPLATGVLLVPQALGMAASMLVTGRLADRVGAGLIVPAGIVLALLGTAAFTPIGGDLSEAVLIAALFLIGLGAGTGLMAAMAAGYRTLSAEMLPSGVSAVNLNQRLGNAAGTAALAIVLQGAIMAGAPRLGDAVLGPLPPAVRTQLRPVLEQAFGLAFGVAFVVLALALVPALLLSRRAGP